MWVGIDDTDSPQAGCTSYTLTEVLCAARAIGLDLIGEPRLVRLNPNVPTKTRGNAALAARLGHGSGSRRRQGTVDGSPLWSYSRGRPPSAREFASVVDDGWSAVERTAPIGTPGTDPVLVASRSRLRPSLYRDAVCRWVPPERIATTLERAGATIRSGADAGGVVGAAAAIAWPGRRATWELIAYRPADRWGTERRVDAASVVAAQRRFPQLFLCYDGRTRRLMVAPHTPCPILYGVRSRRRLGLTAAAAQIHAEPAARWLIFRTNQGTGDHLRRRAVRDLRPYDAARLAGVVLSEPERHAGGHVSWSLQDAAGDAVVCWAFEPTKTLPGIAGALRPGDRIEVWGGRGADAAFRVEGIDWRRRPASSRRHRAPRCERCGHRTRSIGRGRGFRCPACRARFAPESAETVPEPVPRLGVHHPTPSARRHLAPLGPEAIAVT